MNVNKPFYFRRIALLIRNDIQRVYKLVGMVAAAAFFALFWVLYFPLSSNLPGHLSNPLLEDHSLLKMHYDYFWLFLFIGGLLFTNLVLANLFPQSRRESFLTLPADNLEKVAARWILTGLIFPVVALLIYWIFVLFSGWAINRSLGVKLVEMPLFDPFFWRWVFWYIGLQPIFFLGAMSLRRFAAVKTFLIGAFLLLFLSTLFKIAALSFIPDLSFSISFLEWGVFNNFPITNMSSSPELQQLNTQRPGITLIQILVLSSPLFLLTRFLKFKEKEITS